jgi:BsuBI/PstI restriction endonuclease C-terminus.
MREFGMVPVRLPDGSEIRLSAGKHNILQKSIIEEFLPRFAPGAEVLYIGDTTKKDLSVAEEQSFAKIGLSRPARGARLPDVIAYIEERNWVLLIEAFNTSNPISDARLRILEAVTSGCSAGPVYVTAFADRAVFAKFAAKISWETEVWTADEPDHMIHFNGDRFLGPHRKPPA